MMRSKTRSTGKSGKIGVFDSGLGGLIILKSIRKTLPQYDYVYFGDTKNLPYGDKPQREIFDLTIKGIKYSQQQGCSIIIIACNTASAKALRKIQQQWLPKNAPTLKVLGVVVPTIESLKKSDFPAVLLATESTVKSGVYQKELRKLYAKQKLINVAAPTLVPLIERAKLVEAARDMTAIIKPLTGKAKSIILGCTHYPLLAKTVKPAFPKLKFIDQTNIVPQALKRYLQKHQEIKKNLSVKRKVQIYFTKTTALNKKLTQTWFS